MFTIDVFVCVCQLDNLIGNIDFRYAVDSEHISAYTLEIPYVTCHASLCIMNNIHYTPSSTPSAARVPQFTVYKTRPRNPSRLNRRRRRRRPRRTPTRPTELASNRYGLDMRAATYTLAYYYWMRLCGTMAAQQRRRCREVIGIGRGSLNNEVVVRNVCVCV